ncbi:MAG: hypothetical protein J6Q42_03590 [Clostridia bacterium]|jgi:hypothetical protein|nr:hypothetical protein [Clostridia bacterium]
MNNDTINLLKECNSGCKCATNSMEQVMPFIKEDSSLKKLIDKYNEKHIDIGDECHELLNACDKDEKDPPSLAKAFSWVSTEMKLMLDSDTKKIAGIMFDGCSMGIKSLSGYLNQYTDASEDSRRLTRKLIDIEQDFMNELLTMV